MKNLNKKTVEHNLRHAIKKAFFDSDIKGVQNAAQSIFEAGYELEDMNLLPSVLDGIVGILLDSHWSPKIKRD